MTEIHTQLKQVGSYQIWRNAFMPIDEPNIFVTEGDVHTMYLHDDGTFFSSTRRNGKHTGYFTTVEDAEKAIALNQSLRTM